MFVNITLRFPDPSETREPFLRTETIRSHSSRAGNPTCEGLGDVVGVEALLAGMAQVIFYGVQVVEVGVQVRVHQDRRVEEDGERQVEVEREIGEDQGEQHMCDMRMT